MVLFTITCTTCKAKLKVRDAAAIGHILGCPKCGSMVQVAAPEGWKPPESAPGMQQTVDDSSRFGDPKLVSAVDSTVAVNGGKKPQTRWRDPVENAREAGTNDNEAAANDVQRSSLRRRQSTPPGPMSGEKQRSRAKSRSGKRSGPSQ